MEVAFFVVLVFSCVAAFFFGRSSAFAMCDEEMKHVIKLKENARREANLLRCRIEDLESQRTEVQQALGVIAETLTDGGESQ